MGWLSASRRLADSGDNVDALVVGSNFWLELDSFMAIMMSGMSGTFFFVSDDNFNELIGILMLRNFVLYIATR